MADGPHLGIRTQNLRNAHGLSVEQLAERAGCKPELIEELERGKLAPSLSPLSKIARALGVRLGTLLDDEEVTGPIVTREGEYKLVTRHVGTGGAAMEYFGLASAKPARHMDPFIIVIPPGDSHPPSSHEGEEFVFVVEGEIELEYGQERHSLCAGDSIYYDSIVRHRVRALGERSARVMSIVYSPS
jgi:transcriptional regulator with XRE-family HTH domain